MLYFVDARIDLHVVNLYDPSPESRMQYLCTMVRSSKLSQCSTARFHPSISALAIVAYIIAPSNVAPASVHRLHVMRGSPGFTEEARS